MNTKMWVGIAVAVVVIGGGVLAVVKNRPDMDNDRMTDKEEKIMDKKDEAMSDKEKDMMSDEKILGVYMRGGKLFTVWPGNELMALEKDITLKNGTKVMASGKIMKADGSMVVLAEGQVLNADGTVTIATKELMAMSREAGSQPKADQPLAGATASGGKVMVAPDAMMEKDTLAVEKDVIMAKSGMYKDYSPGAVTAEQKAGQKVVLFFHAAWCPYCKAADTAFKANSGKIPAGVTVLKTDYDSNTELKTKYGVTTQHTFVQIDADGKMVTKWVSGDVDMLIKNVK